MEQLLNKLINFFTLDTCSKICKILAIYLITFFIFLQISDKKYRLLYTVIVYIVCIYLFDINYKHACLYVIIAICCVITESLYITYCNETWKYYNPDIINIPYWLISIWSIAILLIIEGVNMLKL